MKARERDHVHGELADLDMDAHDDMDGPPLIPQNVCPDWAHADLNGKPFLNLKAGRLDVAVELTREAEAARHAAEAGRHEVVQVAVGRRRQLERAEA